MSDSLFAPTGYQAPRSGPLSGMDPSADIYKLLLKDRIVFLGTEVSTTRSPTSLCAQLLYLEGEDPNADIWLYINSAPAARCTAGMAIYDTMQFVSCRRGHRVHGPGRQHGPVPACAPAPPASASPAHTPAS
jgi:ATP-dependent protease ClpP protease subunit